jgi:hypothetical protein
MSPSLRSPALRTAALAAALLVAALAAPVAGHAQVLAPERTLLNHIAVPFVTKVESISAPTVPTDRGIAGGVEAERALLGRTPAPKPREVDREPAAVDPPTGMRIDGERALLARVARAETRRSR